MTLQNQKIDERHSLNVYRNNTMFGQFQFFGAKIIPVIDGVEVPAFKQEVLMTYCTSQQEIEQFIVDESQALVS